MTPDGRYTLVYQDGQYRTLRLKTLTEGALAGRTILSIKNGSDFEGAAFVKEGAVYFWKRFKAANTPERLERIKRAFDRVARDPQAAGLAFAMREGACYRCGRTLTVPASVHRGLGPECARKGHWTKQDNQQVYADLAASKGIAA